MLDDLAPTHACCAPSATRQTRTRTAQPLTHTRPAHAPASGVHLHGGEFLMGAATPGEYPEDGEGPRHPVRLSGFAIDPHAVTNDRFAAFVQATGHRTDA